MLAKNLTGLTCSMLPEQSCSPARSKTTRTTFRSSSMMLSFWRKRSFGQWISLPRRHCLALGTAVGTKPAGALHFRPRCGPGPRRLPRRVEDRCPRCPRHCLPQTRMRTDLGELEPGEQEIAELQLLLARRRDLVSDQSRIVTRLRDASVAVSGSGAGIGPEQERSPYPPHYQTPAQLRRAGHKRVASYPRETVASKGPRAYKALTAAKAQCATTITAAAASFVFPPIPGLRLLVASRSRCPAAELGVPACSALAGYLEVREPTAVRGLAAAVAADRPPAAVAAGHLPAAGHFPTYDLLSDAHSLALA